MLYPTITELTKDEFNRYELALATAKCARLITDEYVAQRLAAEETAGGPQETERALINNINKEYRDAITKIHSGEYTIVRTDSEAEATEEAVSTPEVVAEEAASDEE